MRERGSYGGAVGISGVLQIFKFQIRICGVAILSLLTYSLTGLCNTALRPFMQPLTALDA